MGMSTYVRGFKPPDEKWQEMKAIYDGCHKLGIDPPDEVEEFFDWDIPTDNGVEVSIDYSESQDDMQMFYDVDVSKLPKDVTVIRFTNSW